MTAKRTLFGMVTAVILAIAALLLPGTADAHAGHHGAALPLADASASPARQDPISISDVAGEDVDVDDLSLAFLSRVDAPGSPIAGTCHAPCCCMTGGMGCASPVLGPASILSLPPEFGHAAFEATRTAIPPDALRQRLRKPPRA